jgi:hypothetical protein
VEGRTIGKEVVAVSSVHRISEALSDRVHELHVKKTGCTNQALLDVHVKRELQPAELLSSQFYRVGDIIEYKHEDSIIRAPVVSVMPDTLKVENDEKAISLRQICSVFELSRIERGPGEKLLLQEKIKQGDRTFEKGSRQTIAQVKGHVVHFESGLFLNANDGRVRQGDCLTDYKAQGIKGAEVRGIEDNSSAMAMASKEAFHVKGTRHVQNLILHVENKDLYLEAIQRTNVKFSALQLERLPDSPPRTTAVPTVDKGSLLLKIRTWGREFLSRLTNQKEAEQVRHHISRFEALHPDISQKQKTTRQTRMRPDISERFQTVAPSQRQAPRTSL